MTKQHNECAPSEDSDRPGHPPSLIRVFAVRMKKDWVLSYPLSAQRRLWSDWVDAQADLSLRWAHSHFVGFVMLRLIRCGYSLESPQQKLFLNYHYIWQLAEAGSSPYIRWPTGGIQEPKIKLSHHMTKPKKWSVHQAKMQINLGICAVWSVFAVHSRTNSFFMRTAKTQISLGIHAVWSAFAVHSMGS